LVKKGFKHMYLSWNTELNKIYNFNFFHTFILRNLHNLQ
jgi:hypothetical protein